MVLLQQYVLPLGSVTVIESASYFHLVMAVMTYFSLRFVTVAPFGRHAKSTTTHVTMPAPLSWALQECPTLMNVVYYLLIEYPCHALGCSNGQWMRIVFDDPFGQAAYVISEGITSLHVGLLLFVIHYMHRTLLYPLIIGEGAPVPIQITLSAAVYCLLNGRLQLLANIRDGPSEPRFPLVFTSRMVFFWIGILLFFVGMGVNVLSDNYLVRLKKQPPRHTRKIPRGGLFDYVSCANFFGEIVEWCSYSLVVWSTTATTRPESALAAFSFRCTFCQICSHAVTHIMSGT
ncbi:3-oxo-5-alpha-steroid 4-dehydrogenase, putative [Trypanosoma cruzi marinkellei]|uniref:3-oxo-5-alpha-steroid 4-dehydrogenase, putative n=1 Tax=Trypanosoma cruzi marinkellei TaxID=85056 RepID=K2ND36_TRYCR|nr:3-oxo-5-alpha-steroid 4-dehydrogenase, putative [Trypanosoma cruzi marinkellei]